MTDRPPLDDTLIQVAHTWSLRSQCSRLQVGAILVRDGRPVAQGYNGPARGEPACQHETDEKCRVSIHGEANALINAAKDGHATKGAVLYVTHAPCWDCAGLAINAEVSGVVYDRPYRLDDGVRRLEAAGITVRRLARWSR